MCFGTAVDLPAQLAAVRNKASAMSTRCHLITWWH